MKITKATVNAITYVLEVYANDLNNIEEATERMVEVLERFENGEFEEGGIKPRRPEPEEIIEIVAARFQVSVDDLKSPSRKREHVEPRQVSMTLCRMFCDPVVWSFKKIGSIYSRDHSTVMYSTDTVEDLVRTNKTFKMVFDDLLIKVEKLFKVKPIERSKFEHAEVI